MLRFIDVLPLWLFATARPRGNRFHFGIAVNEVKLDRFAERLVPRDSQLFRQVVDGGQVTIRNRDSCVHTTGTAILVPGPGAVEDVRTVTVPGATVTTRV